MARARLQDVAEVAGVSMKTVSNVVRGYVHVSPATRAKVQRAIDDLAYRPNESGRSLATGRTGLLALAFSDISIPYYSELARCVSTLARDRGYRVLLEQTDGTLDAERREVARDLATACSSSRRRSGRPRSPGTGATCPSSCWARRRPRSAWTT
jgi:DNA-binding LacI/PurR family transcriptional regulator